MTGSLSQDVKSKLLALGAATIHEAQGQCGAMDAGIKGIESSMRIVGRAYTVDTRPHDNLTLHFALTKAQPGDVLVVDAKGFLEAGPWGDIMTQAAQAAGLAGMIIDGAVRDASAIIEMGFPIFARGLSIKGTAKNQPGHVQVPIVCGGVPVRPGDIVVGDRDGVVVIEAARLEEAIALSEAREAKEAAFRDAIAQGKTVAELIGLGPVFERLGMVEGR